jgi:hypothetical protein
MSPGKHRVRLRFLVADEFHGQFPRVRARDGQLTLEPRIERVLSHQYDVAKLLAGILNSLVD